MSGRDGSAGGVVLDPAALLAEVVTQRWYTAKDQQVDEVTVVESAAVAPGVQWVLLGVGYTSGEQAIYQLVVEEATGGDVAERPEVLRWMFPDLAVEGVRRLVGEQSNTSLIIDEQIIVKLFRRLDATATGTDSLVRNPDVEVVQRLWEHGFRSLAEPLGVFQRNGRDLAVARRYLARASDGWEMALDDPYFMDEVGELGSVTARLHVVLAEAFGSQAGSASAWAKVMADNLARVTLPFDVNPAARFAALAAAGDVGAAIRIHGDYHLGQVLHWRGRWYVLDFEGEPARPVAERVAASSPLRDVAGMFRSFGYAAAVGGLPPIWETEARGRFWAGYRAVAGVGALLPADTGVVLDAFELDKAVYEVAYERASRPDWEHIPLAAVLRMLR